MGFTFQHLKANKPVLEPVAVPFSWLSQPLMIHQFTMTEMGDYFNRKVDEGDAEEIIRNQVLKFLNGADYEPTEEDRSALGDIFTSWQVREIYTKALKLNGHGPDSLREAEKN